MKIAVRRVVQLVIALLSAVGLATLAASPALAYDWKTDDTDNISRSVSSGRAYTVDGSFVWQHSGSVYKNWRAAFSTNLKVNGPKGSCARLRVITRFGDGSISKRFPSTGSTRFGYYSLCSSTGHAIKAYGGSDISDPSGLESKPIARADISVCYAPNSGTPATQCYNFTVHPGD